MSKTEFIGGEWKAIKAVEHKDFADFDLTSEEWIVVAPDLAGDNDGIDWIVCACVDGIIGPAGESWPAQRQSEANAHLIAAAPEMYEALENLIAWIDPNENYDEPQTNAAYAALAKARGEAT